jgi:hypothetical protein
MVRCSLKVCKENKVCVLRRKIAHTFLVYGRSQKQVLLTCIMPLAVGRESEADMTRLSRLNSDGYVPSLLAWTYGTCDRIGRVSAATQRDRDGVSVSLSDVHVSLVAING